MVNKIFLTSCLLTLICACNVTSAKTMSGEGSEFGLDFESGPGGGHHVGAEFTRIAREILVIMKNAPERFTNIRVSSFEKAINDTEVYVVTEFPEDIPYEALNFPDATPPKIVIDLSKWAKIKLEENSVLNKQHVVLHEYDGILKVERNNYAQSSLVFSAKSLNSLFLQANNLKDQIISTLEKFALSINFKDSDFNEEQFFAKLINLRLSSITEESNPTLTNGLGLVNALDDTLFTIPVLQPKAVQFLNKNKAANASTCYSLVDQILQSIYKSNRFLTISQTEELKNDIKNLQATVNIIKESNMTSGFTPTMGGLLIDLEKFLSKKVIFVQLIGKDFLIKQDHKMSLEYLRNWSHPLIQDIISEHFELHDQITLRDQNDQEHRFMGRGAYRKYIVSSTDQLEEFLALGPLLASTSTYSEQIKSTEVLQNKDGDITIKIKLKGQIPIFWHSVKLTPIEIPINQQQLYLLNQNSQKMCSREPIEALKEISNVNIFSFKSLPEKLMFNAISMRGSK